MTTEHVQPGPVPQRCRSCGANVLWVAMPGGKKMPLDAEPVENGNVCIFPDGVRAVVMNDAQWKLQDEQSYIMGRARRLRYRSHFATCPNAAQHRGGKK